MDRNDRQAIEELFSKLANVEQQADQRDAEADRFIQEQISKQPAAPYYMAQTIVVQEQALEAAQHRIEELEYQAQQNAQRSGGILGSLFGGNMQSQRSAQSQSAYSRSSHNAQSRSPWDNQGQQAAQMQQRNGGGFLAGAAQTAMGVAGGVLLGNAIMGMIGGNEAQASEPEADTSSNDMDDMDFGGDEF